MLKSLFLRQNSIPMKVLFQFLLLLLLATAACQSPPVSHRLQHFEIIELDDPDLADTALLAYIQPYRDALNEAMNEVLVYSEERLTSTKPESPLTSLVADMVLEQGLAFIHEASLPAHPAIALINSRGLRSPLPQGKVLRRHAFEIMPFENLLTAVLLDGRQTIALFDHIYSENGDGLAGATCDFTPDGTRNIRINGKALQTNEYYWIFTSNYLAEGGDGYSMLSEADTIISSNYAIRDIIIEKLQAYASANKKVPHQFSTRIKDLR